ncbi:MAG: YCF48-related protein [Bacteroidota bacterium]
MKKFTILVSFYLVFFSFSLTAQITSSKWLNPKPNGSRYSDVKMGSINNAIAIGADGTIALSTDTGLNWMSINSGTQEDLYTLAFPDVNYGFIGGSNGLILKTTNAGFTWSKENSTVFTHFRSSSFLSRFEGYLIGYNTLLKYNGSTWTELETGLADGSFEDIVFVDSQNGFIGGNDGKAFLIKTTDGGNSWNKVQIPQLSGQATALDFNGKQKGWLITSSGELIRTTNGGLNWSLSFVTSNYISDINFKSDNYGVIVGEKGTVLVSADSGKSWTNKHPLGVQEPKFLSFDNYVNGIFIIAVGTNGEISRTVDGGNLWTRMDANLFPSKVEDIQYLDANIGFIHAAEYYGENDIGIFKTTNGGSTWNPSVSGISGYVADIEIVSSQLAFAISDYSANHKFFKSTTNGDNWSLLYEFNKPCSKIYFLNESLGWALGENEIQKTTNGGSSWTEYQIPAYSYGTTDLFFVNQLRGFITLENGNILKTFDGGITWATQITGLSSILHKIEFADENNGWIVGAAGRALRTTNGGLSWQIVNIAPSTIDLYTIKFKNSLTGYIGGSKGTLLYTIDGGINWFNENSKINSKSIFAIDFTGQNTIVFGGQDGFLKSNSFVEEGMSIQLTSPYQGTSITIDESYELTWISQNVPSVDISYTTNDGLNWTTFVYEYPASKGKYTWTVPYPRNENIRLKISATGNSSVFSEVSEISIIEPSLSWSNLNYNAGLFIKDFTFIGNTGWIISNNRVFYSTDGGTSFNEIFSNPTYSFNAIRMFADGRGIIVGNSGKIFHTTDSGFNWIPASSIVTKDLTCISSTSDKIFVGGKGGTLLNSTDGGMTWMNMPISDPKDIIDIEFPTDLKGYLIVSYPSDSGGEQFFWRTSDGGYSWEKISLSSYAASLSKITFVSENTGYGIENYNIIKTTDGGDSWQKLKKSAFFYLRDIHFSDENFGWVSGFASHTVGGTTHSEAVTLQTTDGGNSWKYRTNGVYNSSIHKVYSPDKFTTYAMTSTNILKYTGEDTPLVRVKSPNGNEFLQIGSNYNITWDFRNITNVKIDYSTNNGTSWSTIVSSTVSNGSYQWLVPNTVSETCKIRITSVDNDAFSDMSDKVFTIYDPTPILELTSPNGGEVLDYTKIFPITWRAQNIGVVQINYSIDGGANWIAIEYTFPAGLQKYNWKVPNTPSDSCLIKISDPTGSITPDISEQPFSIHSNVSSLTLLSPNGGDTVKVGSKYNINWSIGNKSRSHFKTAEVTQLITQINIYLSVDDGATWIPIATSIDAAAETYSWSVPNYVSNLCKLKIFDSNNPSMLDVSDAVFSISDNIYLNNLILSLSNSFGIPGDTVTLDLSLELIGGITFSSGLIKLGDFTQHLQFLEIDTTHSLLSSAGHEIIVNNQDTLIVISFAGASAIEKSGNVLSLKFSIIDDVEEIVPVNISSALFDTGIYEVGIENGYVRVLQPFYGDVDLNKLVQPYDAAVILKYLIGNYPEFTLQQKINADVTLDKSTSALDASVILQYTAGLFETLPKPTSVIPDGDVVLPDFVTAKDGKVLVPIYASNFENVFSFEGRVRFDNSILKFEDIQYENLGTGMIVQDTASKGFVKFAAAATNGIVPEGILFTIEFSRVDSLSTSPSYILYKNMRLNEAEEKIDFDSCLVDLTTDLKDESIPTTYSLKQNFPNPFNPRTVIKFSIPQNVESRSSVSLQVFDILGREVATLVNEYKTPGIYEVTFDGSLLASGLYFYKLTAVSFSQTKKMMLLK